MQDILPDVDVRLIDAYSFLWVINENKRKTDFLKWSPDTGIVTQIEDATEKYIDSKVTGNAQKKSYLSSYFTRSAEVVKVTKERAKGVCQLCGQPAPFTDKNGNPYLEAHHIDKINLFVGFNLQPFLDPSGDPVERYHLLAKAAEYVFVSTQMLQTESNGGKAVSQVSFKTYFLKTVKRMRAAYDVCQPSGDLGEEESALAQCFMAIAGFVRKMSGTSEVDTATMNRHVEKMVEEALKYNKVESVLDDGEQEDIFSPEYFERLADVKMPATKLELLVKMLRKQITEYSKTNQVAAKRFQEMLEETINLYHERRKHLTAEEAGEAQEQTSEQLIKSATRQALKILKELNADRESFRKINLTFEEKAFYDILILLRDEYNFEYGEDKVVNGVTVNEKCRSLAKKIKEIIDTTSSFADWLNNPNVRNRLKFDIKVCLIKNGYPPQYSPEVFRKVMEQVENFSENN